MFKAQNYIKVSDLQEALELNKKRTNKVLGGGCWMKMGKKNINTLIDLSGLGLDKITETDDEIIIGAMVTLRDIESSPVIEKYFGNYFKDAFTHIVGVQFRNCATIGGSVFSRFGFSDIVTSLIVLGTEIELAGGETVSMEEYSQRDYDNDIVVNIHIKKDGRKAAYESFRNTQTDIPVLNCSLAYDGKKLYAAVGARPMRGKVSTMDCYDVENSEEIFKFFEKIQTETEFGTNTRASKEYRKHLCLVLLKRAYKKLVCKEGEQ